VSRSSHPGIVDARGTVGSAAPKLLRVQSVSSAGNVEVYQPPSMPLQSIQHLHCPQADQNAQQQAIQLQMVDHRGRRTQHADLRSPHLHRRASSGAERVFMGQEMGVAMSDGALAPVAEVSPQELCATLLPENGNGPLLVRVGSETHVIQGVQRQVMPQPQRRLSDTGVYLMVRQDDQVRDMHNQVGGVGNVQTLTSFPNQEILPIQFNSQLEPSPFAVAASLEPQDNQRVAALEPVGWNLENVMMGDVQPPSVSPNSVPLANLEQVLHSTNPGAVAIDLTGNVDQDMDTVIDTGQMKMDPMLLTVGAAQAGQDVVMTDAQVCQGPMAGQPGMVQGSPQVQYGQVARLEDILAMVEPSEPPFKQAQFGDDCW